jgi:hypothetical protein
MLCPGRLLLLLLLPLLLLLLLHQQRLSPRCHVLRMRLETITEQ